MPLRLDAPIRQCKAIEKPMVQCLPSKRFGIPAGTAGRGGQSIHGIVIHCLDVTIDEYARQACGAAGKLQRPLGPRASLHYAISLQGGIQQYVADSDMAWGLDFIVPLGTTTPVYNCPNVCGDPLSPCDPPNLVSNYSLLWDLLALDLANGNPVLPATVGPDFYLLHIGVEAPGQRVTNFFSGDASKTGCADCSEPNIMERMFAGPQYRALIHLVAYLADRYQVPVDANHINFFHNIDPCDREECGCAPCGSQFVCKVDAYCQAPDVTAGADSTTPAQLASEMTYLYGQDVYGGKGAALVSDVFASNVRLNTATGKIEVKKLLSDGSTVWTPITEV